MKFLVPALLALAAPAAAQAPDWSKATSVYLTMTNHGFRPRAVTMRQGRPYILHVANRSDQGHNLTAKGFFANARVAPRDRRKVANEQLSLLSGEGTAVRLVAPATPMSRYGFRSTTLADAASDYKGAFYVR